MIHTASFRIGFMAAALAAGATLGLAQQTNLDVKPGLWEITSTGQSSGLPPNIDLGRLTPEQRARVEAAIRARQAKGAQTRTYKSCLTKERLKEDVFSDFGKESGMSCKRTVVSNTRHLADYKLECSSDDGKKTAGSMHIEALSNENVIGTVKMTLGDSANTMNVNVDLRAKWLGDACGDVK